MPWGKVDDNFYDHPKLDRLPAKDRLACIGLHWLAVSWCNRYLTDGEVPEDRVVRLGGSTRLATDLVTAGLWERTGDGYLVHDYLDYNQSRDQIERAREQRSAAGRAGGLAKRRASESSSKSLSTSLSATQAVASDMSEPPSRPVPTRPDSSGRTGATPLVDARELAVAVDARNGH